MICSGTGRGETAGVINIERITTGRKKGEGRLRAWE